MSKPLLYQVVIVGGGVAGCATAIALRRAGVADVLLLEQRAEVRQMRFGESLPPEVAEPLIALGLWDSFLDQGHEPCTGSCSLWGSAHPGYNDFLLNPHGHGWHLDRPLFDHWLREAARSAGVEIWRARMRRIERPVGVSSPVVHLEETLAGQAASVQRPPRRVLAHFMVDATGNAARVARSFGAARRDSDHLYYVGSYFKERGTSRMSRLTLLEAAEYGWWYAARLPRGKVAVAAAVESTHWFDPALMPLTDEAFGSRYQTWRQRLAKTELLAAELEGCYPGEEQLWTETAHSSRIDSFAGDTWLAVGDAAMSFDPIASRGLYQALEDGVLAASVLRAQLSASPTSAREARQHYCNTLEVRWHAYVEQRRALYERERRWERSPFWANRVAPRPRG